jgi:hypothetical protein
LGTAIVVYTIKKLEDVGQMLEKIPKINVVSYNDIAGYAQKKHYDEALKSIYQILVSERNLNSVTTTSISFCMYQLSVSAKLYTHGYMVKNVFDSDILLGSVLFGHLCQMWEYR